MRWDLLAWLATYGLHSTLMLLAAFVIERALRSDRGRELLWRTALFAPIFTATAQAVLLTGNRMALAPATPAPVMSNVALLPVAVEPMPAPPPPAFEIDWMAVGLVGWALIGAVGITWLLVAGARFTRGLGRRVPVDDPNLLAILEEVTGGAPVRLTECAALRAPIALGIARREIALPTRAMHLPEAQFRAMLAHEWGHHLRRDPLWLAASRFTAAVLFFQPLNRMAQRRLARQAEFACDAYAIERTGDRVELAKCLAEVASWLTFERRTTRACAMTDLRSPLGERVDRILDEERPRHRASFWLAPTLALAAGLIASAAPGFAGQVEPEKPDASVEVWVHYHLLTEEMEALSRELDRLHSLSLERSLSPETQTRVELALRLGLELRERHSRIGELLDVWQTHQDRQP